MLGETMPAFAWRVAYDELGVESPFGMQSFFCDDTKYGSYRSLIIIGSAGWCPNCPGYMRDLNSLRDDLAAVGAMVLYVETETNRQGTPASSSWANDHINGIIGEGENSPGIRAGESDAEMPGAFSNQLAAVPTVFIVRREDMVVTFDSSQNGLLVPAGVVSRAGDLTPMIPVPNCTEADEEPSEAVNDAAETAPALTNGEMFDGGICEDGDIDFYNITTAGAWRVNLTFEHGVGDIDIHITPEGMPLGMATVGAVSETDNEELDGSGPALVRVICYPLSRCTNTYSLTFTEL